MSIAPVLGDDFCQYPVSSGGNRCQFPVNNPYLHGGGGGGGVGGVIDKCIIVDINIICSESMQA